MASLTQLHERIKKKTLSCRELIDITLKKIKKSTQETNAFVSTFDTVAFQLADQHDAAIMRGESIALGTGIPVAIKDNMCLYDHPVSCASKILENYTSPYTATSVQQLIDRGFIPVGRTNMDEFAMGSSNETSVYGAVSNPWNLKCVPGGSSGGAAAAIASGCVPVALGSDTGGSIRQPASFCGIVGLKPTYGRVSRYGLVAFASSLDQIGPMTQSVSDSAFLLTALSGYDPQDSTSEDKVVPEFGDMITKGTVKGKRIGVPKSLMTDGIESSVQTSIHDALTILESLGASIEFFDFPLIDEALATYYIIAPAEASSNLSRFDGVRYGYRDQTATNSYDMMFQSRQNGFGDEVKRRIILGTHVLSSGYYDAYYGKAQQMRGVISNRFRQFFEDDKYDLICSPTAPTTAFEKGKYTNNPLQMYLSDLATIPANLAGLPAMSIPCGCDESGLPIGLQFMAPWFDELTMLQVAYAFEQAGSFKPQHTFSCEVS